MNEGVWHHSGVCVRFFSPRMDVDALRTLCSVCEEREVYNIGQQAEVDNPAPEAY